MPRILVVDDEHAICWGLSQLGESLGHEVRTASSAEQGLRVAAANPPDVLVLDVRLPGIDGLTAIEQFRQYIGTAPIIVITAFGDLETAVKAVKNGAFEYVVKPFDLADIRAVVERAIRSTTPTPEAGEPSDLDGATEVDGMLGRTPVMQEVFKRIALAASSDAAVLLGGESGVGKDLAARAIHRHGNRANAPFVAVNVAALSPTLAEAELFGHTAGAFTGANHDRKGLLVHADGGTLFLDEVADIPLPLQVKLLRALDQGEILPVGADQPVRTRFRVVSATHRDLQALVRRGAFRHDLFYRLSAFEIPLPPLRERADDIELLATSIAARLGSPSTVLARETIADLQGRAWHGNVRELHNAIEHALVVAPTGVVLPEHLPAPQPLLDHSAAANGKHATPLLAEASGQRAQELLDDPTAVGSVYDRFLQEAEAPLLAGAMKRFDNECAPAARVLGMHRTTLKKKLEQHGIDAKKGS
jgi:two-component system nitrogen regulation response regulator GlnG